MLGASRSLIPVATAGLVLALVAGGLFYVMRPRAPASTVPSDAGAPSDSSVRASAIQRGPRQDPRPDILLFTIDTLRADHLSSYGYPRETTPTLDALGRRGTRFERAYSTSSWTLPALASLVSGVLPSQHGVNRTEILPDHVEQDLLSSDLPSLAAMLHDAGYRTVGVTTNTHLLSEFGFARGFDDYECTNFGTTTDARPAIWRRLDALRQSETPYFFWVHLTDPHMVYQAREPQFSQWWPATRPRHPALERSIFLAGIRPVVEREQISVAEGLEYVSALYDSEIRATDDFLADLLGELDDGHLAVVFLSDHGEELNDHFQMGHGTTLFEEVVHVPLVVALPGQTPSVVATPVSIVDVLPTIAEIVGAHTETGSGTSLVSAMRGEPLSTSREVVMETSRRSVIRAIIGGSYEFAERVEPNPIDVLYDLASDPHEQHQCLAEHPDVGDALRQRLHDALDAARARRPDVTVEQLQLPDEIREQLQALGYGN